MSFPQYVPPPRRPNDVLGQDVFGPSSQRPNDMFGQDVFGPSSQRPNDMFGQDVFGAGAPNTNMINATVPVAPCEPRLPWVWAGCRV